MICQRPKFKFCKKNIFSIKPFFYSKYSNLKKIVIKCQQNYKTCCDSSAGTTKMDDGFSDFILDSHTIAINKTILDNHKKNLIMSDHIPIGAILEQSLTIGGRTKITKKSKKKYKILRNTNFSKTLSKKSKYYKN